MSAKGNKVHLTTTDPATHLKFVITESRRSQGDIPESEKMAALLNSSVLIGISQKFEHVLNEHCALKTLNKAGFEVDKHITVSKDLKISKNFDLNSETDTNKISEAIVKNIMEV